MKKMINQRNSDFLIRIIIILLTSSIFMSLSFIIQRSLFETNRENMLDIYGEWQGAYYDLSENQSQMIENNQLIAQSAEMNLIGQVIDMNRTIGGIGYVDERMIEMGRLTLIDGHWPIMDNEIVAESYILDKLHISYELGQIIALNIQLKDSKEMIETEFILSGVLKSYSSNWKSDSSLVSVFTNGNLFKKAGIKHVFVKCEKGYEDVLDSLLAYEKPCIKNNTAAFPFDITNYGNQSYLLLLILTFILSVTLIFIGYYLFLMREKVNLITLRALGMSLNQIRYQLFKYTIMIWVISSIANYLVCTISLSLLEFIFKYFTQVNIILSYSLSDWLVVTMILFIISILGLAFASIFISRLILTGNFNNNTYNVKHRRKYRGKYLSSWHLGMIHLRDNVKANFLQVLSITILLLTSFCLIYNYQEEHKKVQSYENTPDYVIDGRVYSAMYPRQNIINDMIFEDLKYMNGIDMIYSYYQSDSFNDNFAFEWEGYENSIILKEIPFLVHNSGKAKGKIVVVDNELNPELFELIIKDIDEGTFDIDEFNKGNSAIICLPDLLIPKEWTMLEGGSYQFYQGGVISDDLMLLHDDTLDLNQIIHVEREDFDDTILLTGIIRQFNNKRLMYMFYDVYGLIVSPSFMPQLDGVNEINIYLEPNANADVLDKQVSILTSEYSGIKLINYRESVSLMKAGLQAKLILYATLFTCILSLVALIQVFISYNKCELAINQIEILKKLGASRRVCRIYYLSGELMNVFVSVVLANVIFFLMLFVKLSLMNVNLNIKYTFTDILYNYSLSYHFLVTMIISIVFLMISEKLLKRSIKKS